jgi:epoxyqueuosine reductase
MNNMASRELRLKEQARRLGFDLVGIARATPADGFARLQDWLARGFAGEMLYMHRHAEARRHPAAVLAEVRSVVMVGMSYKPQASISESGVPRSGADGGLRGRVARYAQGDDYHGVLRERLNALLRWLRDEVPESKGRGVVDTAPLLERDFARRAGLGWFGKNTMLIDKRLGSYFFLGALLLDLDLTPDAPHEASHCGTCTACLDACPTEAFAGPGLLDSRRCVSYLTIELRGPIAEGLRAGVGNWVFGCDVCQEVCPWNRKAPPGREPALQPRDDLQTLELCELLCVSEAEYRGRFRGTAVLRAQRGGLLRNAAIVLGNRGDRAALPALGRALDDPDALVREAARWAIERIAGPGIGSDEAAGAAGKPFNGPAGHPAGEGCGNGLK